MSRSTQFGTGAIRTKSFLITAGMAVFAAMLCMGIGCSEKDGGGGEGGGGGGGGEGGGGGGGGKKSSAYLITFDPNGGDVPYKSDTTGANGTLDTLPTATWDGYTFNGWFTAKTDGDTVTTNTVFTKDATIYAQWTEKIIVGIDTTDTDTTAIDTTKTPDTYVVTFDSRGGSAVEAQFITHGGTIEEPAEPTRTDGQNFAGWYTDSTDFTDEWDFAAAVTESITLYARWTTLPVHIITFNTLIDGAEHITQPVIEGDTVIFSAATRAGYTLEGWYTDSDLTDKYVFATPVTAPITLYAKWTINKYTVKFFDYNGTELKSDTVDYGSGTTAPTSPLRTGYTFKNWDKTFSAVTENLTVTAVYEINKYTVKFVDYDGTTVLKTEQVNYNTGATAPTPPTTRTGYTFASWDKAFSAVTGDLTVTAVYEINKYTVKFVDYDGTELEDEEQTVNYNTVATAPTEPTRENYTLDGWYTEDATAAWDFATDVVTSDVTLYAKWTWSAATYTVTFNVNGSGGTVSPSSGTTGEGWKLTLTSLPTPTRDGYLFNGWFTAATDGDKVTINDVYNADADIYAQWVQTYQVWFDVNGGRTLTPEFGSTGIDGTLASLPTPTGYGNTFTGWFTSSSGGTAVTVDRKYTASVYIYAHWSTGTPTPTKTGVLTDSRDNKTYKTVEIGEKTWMAENLNYDGTENGGTAIGACYGNDPDSCNTYGRLYDWATAMNNAASSSANPSGIKGACPVGWHLPSNAEWVTLTSLIGGTSGTAAKLKSSQYWSPVGTDDYGFTGLPGGSGSTAGFNNVGSIGTWWTATDNGGYVWSRALNGSSTNVSVQVGDKTTLYSVRCVQD